MFLKFLAFVDIIVILTTFITIQVEIGFQNIDTLCGNSAHLQMRACPDVMAVFFLVAGLVITRQVKLFNAKTLYEREQFELANKRALINLW